MAIEIKTETGIRTVHSLRRLKYRDIFRSKPKDNQPPEDWRMVTEPPYESDHGFVVKHGPINQEVETSESA